MATTTISVTITTPAGVTIQNVLDVLCPWWGYTGFLPDKTTPETQAAFVKRKVAEYLRQQYIAAKATQDGEAARQASITTASQVTAA